MKEYEEESGKVDSAKTEESSETKEKTPQEAFAVQLEELQETMGELVKTLTEGGEGETGESAASRAEEVLKNRAPEAEEKDIVAALLGPLVSKEVLYGPMSQIKDKVCFQSHLSFNSFIFVFYTVS